MSYKWWNSTDTLLLASLFNMVSRVFGERSALLWAHEPKEGKCGRSRRGMFKWAIAAWSLWEGSAVGAPPHPWGCHQHPRDWPWAAPAAGRTGRGAGQGDRDNHTSRVNCYKYQESNQYVKMCVPLFTCMRRVNEKRREGGRAREKKERLLKK